MRIVISSDFQSNIEDIIIIFAIIILWISILYPSPNIHPYSDKNRAAMSWL